MSRRSYKCSRTKTKKKQTNRCHEEIKIICRSYHLQSDFLDFAANINVSFYNYQPELVLRVSSSSLLLDPHKNKASLVLCAYVQFSFLTILTHFHHFPFPYHKIKSFDILSYFYHISYLINCLFRCPCFSLFIVD